MDQVQRRTFSDEKKEAIVDGFLASGMSQRAYAASLGLPQRSLSDWVRRDRGAHRSRAELARREPGRAPEMLEVVPGRASALPVTSSRVILPGSVEVVFDGLVPPSWVAELVAELRRC